MALDWNKVLKQKEELESRLARGNGGGGVKWWKPANGENRIRILPGWADEGDFAGQFWREVYQHWNVNPEEQKGPLLCPKHTPGVEGACPICEFVEELKADKSDAAAQKLYKDLRAKGAFLLNIIDLKSPEYTAEDVAEWKKARPEQDVPFEVGDLKIQTWACQTTTMDQIFATMKTNELDITDLEEGKNLAINKFPNKDPRKTRYEVSIIIKSKPVVLPEGTKIPDLSMVNVQKSYDDMRKLLTDGVGGDFTAGAKQLTSGSKTKASGKAGGAKASSKKDEEDELPKGWGGSENDDDAESLMSDMEAALGDDD